MELTTHWRVHTLEATINPTRLTTHNSVGDHLLTEGQAADVLSLKPATLRAWRSTGRPGQPRFVKIGRSVRYRESDVAEYIGGLVEGGDAA